MIQPKELRVGNWVYSKTYAKPMRFISFFGLCNLESSPYLFEPIPLTPEILEKAGFEFNGKLYYINNNKYHTFSILFGEICYPYIANNHHEVKEHFSLYGIKHLHQLQNLYFALTGEELEIELM